MGAGRGERVDRSAWPDEGPTRKLLELLDKVRAENGMTGLRTVARRMGLSSPTRVSHLLRGAGLPADEPQLDSLVRALGGGDEDVVRARRLYALATAARSEEAAATQSARRQSRSGWLEQVRDIAPAGGLVGREAERAELAEFCAGDEPYVWWQAPPWAGKSALLSSFVLDPPTGVDTVGFFLAAHAADAGAFTHALLEQLAAFTDQAVTAPPGLGARDAYRRRLLRDSAARCRAAGRRLVLVVDGLDEDQGARPGSGLPSIASLLPKTSIDGLKVIVTSRPAPAVAADLDQDHPLLRCRVRHLAVSRYATQLERLARNELNQLLASDPVHRELLGLLTASGSGLTLTELEELTGRARFEIDQPLDSVLGRTVAERADHVTVEPRRVVTFTHETLRAEATDRFGDLVLDRYRDRFHTWADLYRHQRWPQHTPGYLVRGYPQLLFATADWPRLVVLAMDRARHDRLLGLTGGAAAAFAEVQAALDLVGRENRRNLPVLARLAVCRSALEHRDPDVPVGLPAAWAALGHTVRAESMANSITDPVSRAQALTEVEAVLAAEGDQERADGAAPGGSGPSPAAPQPSGKPGRPEPVADAVPARDDRALALFALCDVLSQHIPDSRWPDELARAAELAQESGAALKSVRQWAAQAVGPASRGSGDSTKALMDKVETEAGSIATANERVEALALVLDVCARTGDLDRAVRIAGTLREAAEALEAPGRAYADVVDSLLARTHYRVRPPDELRRTARAADQDAELTRATAYNAQALALATLAHALAVAGRRGDAHRVAAEAEVAADHATPLSRRAQAFTTLAWTYVLTGDRRWGVKAAELAGTAARSAGRPDQLAYAVIALAQALTDAGFDERADRAATAAVELTAVMAESVGDPEPCVQVLVEMARLLAEAARPEQAGRVIANAEAVAARIADPLEQAKASIALIGALNSAGLPGRAARLADQAVDQAYVVARAAQQWHHLQAQLLTTLADDLADVGHPTQATSIARAISHFPSRRAALAHLARPTNRPKIAAPDPMKSALVGVSPQVRLLAEQAYDLAARGDHEQAADLAAQLLAAGPWTAAVPTLAIVDHDALLAAAEDLLDSLVDA
ncbi:hypothetical protein GCM10010440_39420 [Kitasatospora cinereorecta]